MKAVLSTDTNGGRYQVLITLAFEKSRTDEVALAIERLSELKRTRKLDLSSGEHEESSLTFRLSEFLVNSEERREMPR